MWADIYDVYMALTPEQSHAARDLLGWTIEDLAHAAGISIFTIRKFERGEFVPDAGVITSVQRAFEGAGVEFAPPQPGRPGVRMTTRRR